MTKWKFAVLALLAGGVASPALAQNAYEQMIDNLLDAAAGMAAESGYDSEHSRHYGMLESAAKEPVTLSLAAGRSYFIVGQCDSDCSDLDLGLYDDKRNLVSEDVLDDDTPIVQVSPVRNGTFTLSVGMVTCSSEPCYYGVSVFEK